MYTRLMLRKTIAQIACGRDARSIASAAMDEHHPRDHGVPDEPVGPAHDQAPRRVPRRERSLPLGGEAAQRGEEQDQADR